MSDDITERVRKLVSQSVGGEYRDMPIPDGIKLIGNLLDSMAVNSLIVALEENFGFAFEDEDLSAEAFETVESLAALVARKV
ncbi:MAG: acyl carrier protein [Fibrobacterota bacterium]|nr:acyl carrier protein [Fibrobacterota bacterium]